MAENMRWDLSPLYESFKSDKFAADKEKIENTILEANTWADNNLHTPEDAKEKLEHIIAVMKELYALMEKLSAFTQLTLATDATNEEALETMFRLEKIDVSLDEFAKKITRFVGDVEDLDGVIASSALLREHEFILNEQRLEASHLLGADVEPVISKLTLTGSNAWGNMRNMIDGTMEVEIEQDGEIKSLPLPIVRNMAYSPDAEVRKKAYEAELASYKKIEIPLSAALNAIKGEGNTMCELRGYESLLHKTLETSRMDKQTLDAMISAMEDFLPDFRRYLKAKAKLAGAQRRYSFL